VGQGVEPYEETTYTSTLSGRCPVLLSVLRFHLLIHAPIV